MAENRYTMSLSLNVLNHLGLNLYSNIPAVLSEIVANSWDADATEVSITINNEEITIEDNGCGMNVDEINKRFLKVGYQKRVNGNISSSKFNRPFMGRKGIGKLSMFSIAREVDVISKKDDEINALRMNLDDITQKIKNEDRTVASEYHPQELDVSNGFITHSGTKIILRDLKKNTSSLTPEYIKKRVSRRFGIISPKYNFKVYVNGNEVSIQDRDYFHKLDYIWTYGDTSLLDHATQASYNESRDFEFEYEGKQYSISGWIGTVESAGDLKDGDENLNKIVVLVRGKLGQEDILAEYSEGGLYSKYLIGELNADFFDDDDNDDMATSSRQEYLKDDERYLALKHFIHDELKYIQGKWTDLRNESGEEKAVELVPIITEWLKSLNGDDKNYAKKMFGKINQIATEDDKKREVIKYSILAFEKLRYTNQLSKIDSVSSENFEAMKNVFIGIDDLEATLYYQIIKDRMTVIKKFQEITDENVKEKIIQEYLFDHLWLLDPSWERTEGTEFMEKSVLKALETEAALSPEEQKGRLDIGYRTTAGKHIIVELKRSERIVKFGELLDQVKKYYNAMKKTLNQSGHENEPIEIICVLGKPVDNDSNPDEQDRVNNSLKSYNARIVFYNDLIENAYKSYNDYIVANKTSQSIQNIITQLEEDAE